MDKKGDSAASMQKAMEIAKSDAGKQLYSLLQKQNSKELQEALNQAATGNYEQVKNTMASLLSSQDVQALLKQMGG